MGLFKYIFFLCVFLTNIYSSDHFFSSTSDEDFYRIIAELERQSYEYKENPDESCFIDVLTEENPAPSVSFFRSPVQYIKDCYQYYKEYDLKQLVSDLAFLASVATVFMLTKYILVTISNSIHHLIFDPLQPFDIAYENWQQHGPQVVETTKAGTAVSQLIHNNTLLVQSIFALAGHALQGIHPKKDLLSGINQETNGLLVAKHGRVTMRMKTIFTRLCFDEDQNYTIQSVTNRRILPINESRSMFQSECDGTEVIFAKWPFLKAERRKSLGHHANFDIKVVHAYHRVQQALSTQRALLQLPESQNDGYLRQAEAEFRKKTALQSVLAMILHSLNEHQCPSEQLFDKFSQAVFSLRWVVPHLDTEYVRFKLWYREDGSLRHVVSEAVNPINDTNANKTGRCDFESQADLEGADARFDLAARHYWRIVTHPFMPSITLDQTITKWFDQTISHPLSLEQSKTYSKSEEISSSKTKTKTPLSREQYYALLERGIYFNESDAYLNSVLPFRGISPYYTSNGRWSYDTLSPEGNNIVRFKTIYPLMNTFKIFLDGGAYGNNSGQMMKIYISDDNWQNASSETTSLYTGNYSPTGVTTFSNYAKVNLHKKNASSIIFVIPYPQFPTWSNSIKVGIFFKLLKIIPYTETATPSLEVSETASKSITPLSREQYYALLERGIYFNYTKLSYLLSIFPKINGLDRSEGIGWARWSSTDETDFTSFEGPYPFPDKFKLRLIGGSYYNNSEQIMKIYTENNIPVNMSSETPNGLMYTGNTCLDYLKTSVFFDQTVIVNQRGKNASTLRFKIPYPQFTPWSGRQKNGIAFTFMQIIPTNLTELPLPYTQSQYREILESGIIFSDNGTNYLSLLPKVKGLSCGGDWGKWSNALLDLAGSNMTAFKFLYPLPSRFMVVLDGQSAGNNAGQQMPIYLADDISDSLNNIQSSGQLYTGKFVSNTSFVNFVSKSIIENRKNLSTLLFKIPYPHNFGDGRLIGIAFKTMKIIPYTETATPSLEVSETASKSITPLP